MTDSPITEDVPSTEDDSPEVTVPTFDMTTAEGIAAAVEDAGDARLAEGMDIVSALEEARTFAKRLVTQAKSLVTVRKNNAKSNVLIRAMILIEGGPDWAGASQAYKRLVSDLYTEAFEGSGFTKSERDRELNAVKQHVNRTYLELGIRQYVRTMLQLEEGAEATDPRFVPAVKAEYVRCNLTIPNAYLTPEEREASGGGGGGGGGGGTTSAKDVLNNAAEGMAQVTALFASKSILRYVSDLALRVTDPKAGAVEDRPEVTDTVQRVQIVAAYIVKALDGKTTEKDVEGIAEVLFDPKKDN
jgi:hypothetical protein